VNKTRSIAFRILPLLAQRIPLKLLIRAIGKKIIFPFYHLVSDVESPHVKHLYQVRTTKEFIRDLDFLLSQYKPIGISDLLNSINAGIELPGNCFLLSFDDGLREFYDVVAPILLRKGIPALCFLNSGFIDNTDLFYRYKASLLIEKLQKMPSSKVDQKLIEGWFDQHDLPFSPDYEGLLKVTYSNRHLLDVLALLIGIDFTDYLKSYRPYLDSSQITSLIQQGFSFGAHSIDHPEYKFLTEDEQLRQTKESIQVIKDNFGIGEKLFSFPFTDQGVTKSFFDKVFTPSEPIADLTFGGAGLKEDSIRRNIQRIPFEGTSLSAKQILGTEYLYYTVKAFFGRNLIKR
jgi:peptidoglycan/xylan/chitin deacetylase (PgdA/CDA1 family)